MVYNSNRYMSDIKRQWELLPKEKRRVCAENIINFFREKRDEELGVIAAEDILDFFLEDIGPMIYNKGVEDSREALRKQFDNLDMDLTLLLRE